MVPLLVTLLLPSLVSVTPSGTVRLAPSGMVKVSSFAMVRSPGSVASPYTVPLPLSKTTESLYSVGSEEPSVAIPSPSSPALPALTVLSVTATLVAYTP